MGNILNKRRIKIEKNEEDNYNNLQYGKNNLPKPIENTNNLKTFNLMWKKAV